MGGIGNKIYWLRCGYGFDALTEDDATSSNTDIAQFDAGTSTDQLWFMRTGNSLGVSAIGGTAKFSLANWYLGNQHHMEQFTTSDATTLNPVIAANWH